MNQSHVQTVQESFEKIKPISNLTATLFYDRLFELDPGLRPYFKGDLSEQKAKLMASLAFVVAGLDRPETILPAVRAMGKRHVGYGVQPDHYETVGAALLWAVEQGLGEQFTLEVEAAWMSAYNLLARVMQEAALEVY